jgi:hypothetical protein
LKKIPLKNLLKKSLILLVNKIIFLHPLLMKKTP